MQLINEKVTCISGDSGVFQGFELWGQREINVPLRHDWCGNGFLSLLLDVDFAPRAHPSGKELQVRNHCTNGPFIYMGFSVKHNLCFVLDMSHCVVKKMFNHLK